MAEIPVQNVYYLLCYAWDQMKEGEVAEVGGMEQTELADLFAQVLINGTKRVARHGLDRGYVHQAEDTTRLRGRVDFSSSVKRVLFPRAKAHCHFDELSIDILLNRILKAALWHLARVSTLSDKHRNELLLLHRQFRGVGDIPFRRSAFRHVQIHSNNGFYRFLMNVCALIQQSLVVQEGGSGHHFRDFRREDAIMSTLFEKFVRKFYTHEQRMYTVDAPHIQWDLDEGDASPFIPRMETDVVLRSPTRAIIIDTKYYQHTLSGQYDQGKFRSTHLYQLFAYLKNAEAMDAVYKEAEGMLLYPTVQQALDESFTVQGHRMRICTINLAQPWQGIHDDLLGLIG